MVKKTKKTSVFVCVLYIAIIALTCHDPVKWCVTWKPHNSAPNKQHMCEAEDCNIWKNGNNFYFLGENTADRKPTLFMILPIKYQISLFIAK